MKRVVDRVLVVLIVFDILLAVACLIVATVRGAHQ